MRCVMALSRADSFHRIAKNPLKSISKNSKILRPRCLSIDKLNAKQILNKQFNVLISDDPLINLN